MPNINPHFGIYITHEIVTGKRAQMADAISCLSRLNIHDVLNMIAILNATFVDPPSNKEEMRKLQNLLVSRLFDTDLKKKLKASRYNTDIDFIIFHRQQQLIMLKLALMACPMNEGSTSDDQAHFLFGKACLMVNDIAGSTEDEIENDKSSLGIAARLLPIGELPSDIQSLNLVGRSYEMWLQIPDQLQIQNPEISVPIATRFAENYDISLEHFVQGLFIILVKPDNFTPHKQNALDALLINANTYLDDVSFPKETFQKILNNVSCKIETLKDKIFTDPMQNNRFDFSLLRHYPLIEIKPNIYLCHDIGFLRRFFTDGIYWRIHDALNPVEQPQFRTFFGNIFADYVEKTMTHIYETGQNAPKHLLIPQLKFTENRGEVCDIFIQCEDAWIMIETKASLLTTRVKYMGDGHELEKEIQAKFVSNQPGKKKGIGQLTYNIKRIVDGIPTNVPEIQLQKCRRIYPVLICYDLAIVSPAIPQYLENQFSSIIGDMPPPPKIMPLTVLSIEDIEMLATIQNKHEISTILSTYHHNRFQAETLSAFLIRYSYYKIDFGSSKFYNSFLTMRNTVTSYFE